MSIKRFDELDSHELAWAAGFLDGEGCWTFHKRARCTPQLKLSLAQANRQPLERFQAAVGGLGRIYGPYRNQHGKDMYQYVLCIFEQSQHALTLLWRWLGPYKRAQAAACLRQFHNRGTDVYGIPRTRKRVG